MFQVANFIYGKESEKYKLLPNDKHILMLFAKHSGPKGIYPSISTLAKELRVSERYVKTRIDYLAGQKLIFIQRINGRKNYYTLCEFSLIGDPQITGELEITGDPQITPPVICRSPHPASVDHPISSISVQSINTERDARAKHARPARKERLPLSESFSPNAENQKRLAEAAQASGKSPGDLLKVFRNIQISKDKLSYDWQAEFENFLINERPALKLSNLATPAASPSNTIPFWGPGHPGWEALHGKRERSV